jgi:hypothetical protein
LVFCTKKNLATLNQTRPGPFLRKMVKIAENRDHNIDPQWEACDQGDLIKRIGQFIRILKRPKHFALFQKSIDYILILTKKGWATFWLIFPPTHQVTLLAMTIEI